MDHVNGDRADNRWCNLREATQSQNQANTSMRADNISGYKGVCWHKGHRKWTAKIQVSGERRYLGYFDTPERAFIAYMFAAWKHHGDFARISTPESRAALEQLKGFVRDIAPAGKINAHAFRLLGESQAKIDGEAHELFEALMRQSPPFSRSEAFGLAFALRELVCERIREIEGGAS